MRCLVTGGCGFIGSALVRMLANMGHTVVVLDDLSSGREENLKDVPHLFVKGSILEHWAMKQAMYNVNLVFHLAAVTSVPESIRHPSKTIRVNTLGTLEVLRMAQKAKAQKVVIASSAAVYGNAQGAALDETQAGTPISPYGETKLSAEHYCRMFDEWGWINTTSLRFFNVYGPRQRPDSAYAAVIPKFIDLALDEKPLTIYGSGNQTRDFVFVEDVARALIYAALNPITNGEAFNVCRRDPLPISALARGIVQMCGSSSEIQFANPRPGDIEMSVGNGEKLAKLGFTPATELTDGLRATIEYFVQKKMGGTP